MERDIGLLRESKDPTKKKKKKKNKTPAVGSGLSIHKYAYPMNHKRRGKAIIFNHSQFINFGIPERRGSEVDERRLTEEFEKLGFEVDLQSDRTFKGIKRTLREISKEDHTDADCLVVVVMSHGNLHDPEEHPIRDYSDFGYGSSSVLAACDDFYDEEKIFEPFQGDKCPTLVGKPKIFFIQACRGPVKQDMVIVRGVQQSDDFVRQSNVVPQSKKEDTYAIPTTADFLIARATYEGTKSFRDIKKGSPFIQTICDELNENNTRKKPLDLETLLTNVKRKVASTIQQMPTTYSTLIRRLYLTPKRDVDDKSPKSIEPQPHNAVYVPFLCGTDGILLLKLG